MKKGLFVFAVVIFLHSCSNFNKNANCTDYSVNNIDFCDFKLIDSIGKEIIPDLIDSISNNKKNSIMGYYNKKMSTIMSFQINNFAGIAFALKIEYILGLDYLAKHQSSTIDSNFCSVPLFQYGIIFKTENDSVLYEKLCYSDMLKIQKIYSAWWSENKDRPLDSLQKDWNDDKRPLNDSCGYVWK